MTGFFRFVLVLLLLTVVAMSSAIVTMHYAIHGTEVTTPDFSGMTLQDAGRRAAAVGLSLHVESQRYSADIPAGRVAEQSPVPGTIVRRGWRVWLTQSLGPQKLAVPSLTGQDQRLATIEIRRAGLQSGITADLPWAAAAPGTVIAQDPQADATGVATPMVNLLLAAPETAANQGEVMPDVEGEIFTAAAYELARAGLRLAPVREQDVHLPSVSAPGTAAAPPAPTPPAGTVIAQNPPAGYRVDATTMVELTVAK